ncbi:MAG: hypothetical protein ACMUIG_10160 [Thermoplasmatota archaeon]
MDQGTIWIIPRHVRPVVSYDKLRKSRIETARSGLDRLNLTDIGDAVLTSWIKRGGFVRLESADLPFPWSASLSYQREDHARMTGMMIMGSTFRSIFRMDVLKNGNILDDGIRRLGRDPLISPYWNDETWKEFHSMTGITRDEAKRQNESILPE